jgi:hypothetical protein
LPSGPWWVPRLPSRRDTGTRAGVRYLSICVTSPPPYPVCPGPRGADGGAIKGAVGRGMVRRGTVQGGGGCVRGKPSPPGRPGTVRRCRRPSDAATAAAPARTRGPGPLGRTTSPSAGRGSDDLPPARVRVISGNRGPGAPAPGRLAAIVHPGAGRLAIVARPEAGRPLSTPCPEADDLRQPRARPRTPLVNPRGRTPPGGSVTPVRKGPGENPGAGRLGGRTPAPERRSPHPGAPEDPGRTRCLGLPASSPPLPPPPAPSVGPRPRPPSGTPPSRSATRPSRRGCRG